MDSKKDPVVNTNEEKKNILGNFDIDSFQKYILGFKKNGSPRAVYDVIRDYQKIKKRKKNKTKKDDDCIMYFPSLITNGKKKKKKKKKK